MIKLRHSPNVLRQNFSLGKGDGMSSEIVKMKWILRKWVGKDNLSKMTDDEVRKLYEKYRQGKL